MNCPKCNSALAQNAVYCNYCGAKIHNQPQSYPNKTYSYNQADDEVNYLQKAFKVLSILLIAGVILPILQPKYGFGGNVEVIFINFKILSEKGVNFFLKVGAIYPLLAGIAILIINHPQNELKLFTKSLVIMIISVLPFLFLFSESSFLTQLSAGQSFSNLIQNSVLGIIGLLLLLSSGLCLRSGRTSIIVKVLVTIAASLYLLSQLIPINNDLPLESIFNLLTYEHNSPGGLINILGLAGLVSTGLLVASSIYALLVWNVKYLNIKTGILITKLWIGSQITLLVAAGYSLIVTVVESNAGAEIGLALLVIIKLVILIYGLILLASISIANFITMIPSDLFLNNYSTNSSSGTFSRGNPDDVEIKLLKLKEMYEKGIINKEEYDFKKREYVNRL